MPTGSLYDVLGVGRDASTEEIRRAYKDQAKQKHPDRGGDPEAFKAIQEAHEVLADDQRRRMYDATGSVNEEMSAGPMGGMAAGGIPFEFMGGMGPFGMPGVSFDFGSMFGNMFGRGPGGPGGPGGGPRRPRPGKGPNKHHDIALSLSDFYHGREIKMKFKQGRRCTGCAGSGAEATESCGACEGRGMRTSTRIIGPGMIAQSTGPCDVCQGEGTRVVRVCRGCQGKKFVEREKELIVKITTGMREGQQLVFAGECSDSVDFEEPGDVVLTLKRADPPQQDEDAWEWRGRDLWIRKRITFAESLVGFRRTLDGHPSGRRIVVGWNKGAIVQGAVLQAPGWGMSAEDGAASGICYIQLLVSAPEPREWTDEERETLRSLLGGEPDGLADEEGVVALQVSSLSNKSIPTFDRGA